MFADLRAALLHLCPLSLEALAEADAEAGLPDPVETLPAWLWERRTGPGVA